MEQAIRMYLKEQIVAEQFAGAVFAVSHRGERIVTCAVGHAVVQDEQNIPMCESTVVDLASVTKIYVSTLMLKLISEGKCSLDTPVHSLLPEIKRNPSLQEKMKAVTVYDLLTHTSGIQAWFPFYTEQDRSFYAILDAHIQVKQTAKNVEYSDVNFMLVGKIIEQITGLSLDRAMHEYIAVPLDMQTLTYGPIDATGVAATSWGNTIEQDMCKKKNKSFSSWRTNDPICGEVNDGNCHYYFHGVSGHAGLFANVQDVLRLGELYLKGGEWGKKRMFNQELIHQSMQANKANRGLGWEIGSVFPEGCGHTGFTGTSIWVVPEKELTVALLTNRLHVQQPTSIQHVRAHVHDIVLKWLEQREGLRK